MPPVDHPLNLLTQSILVYASYAIFAVILVVALRMSLRQRTPFFVFLVLAAAVGGYVEPLYDEAFTLWFYAPGQWSAFTSFGIPQPYWVYSGYAILYGATALLTCQLILQGRLTRNGLLVLAGFDFLCSCTFEIFGINGIGGGAYEYWGPHVMRLFNYPITIGVLEATQVTFYSVMAAELFQRVGSSKLATAGLFVLFPITFLGANFGTGAPLIIALHLPDPTPNTIIVASLASIGLAFSLVWALSRTLPENAKAVPLNELSPSLQDRHQATAN